MLPESSTNLIGKISKPIIAIFRACSRTKCRSRLSKAANLLLAFPSFCHSEIVYDTGSVCFTEVHALYSLESWCLACFVKVLLCSFCHIKFRKWPLSTAVGHHES